MRDQVEAMLAAQNDLGDFLQPVVEAGALNDGAEMIGQQVGPHKILQQIGEGGFGVAYMAEQETPIRRKMPR